MACSPDWKTFLRLRFVPFPWFCSGSSGRRNTRGGRNRAAKSSCEIELRNRASAGRASFASGLFRFRGSVPALRVGGTLGAVGIEGVKSGFGWQSVLCLRFVPFPWFCSGSSGRRNTRVGGTRGAVEIEGSKSGFGRRSVLRLRFVPFPGFCFGSSGRRNTRGGRNRGFEIGLRQAERPSPPVCSVYVVLFRLFRSAEHSGRLKSGCEIGLRNRASACGMFFGTENFL